MGFAIPGIVYQRYYTHRNDYLPVLLPDEGDGIVSRRFFKNFNRKYGIQKFHFKLVNEILQFGQNRHYYMPWLRNKLYNGFPRNSELNQKHINALNSMLRYIYAVDSLERKSRWRLDYIIPVGSVIECLIQALDINSHYMMDHVTCRTDGRYFLQRYYRNRTNYIKRIVRPKDSQGVGVEDAPGVFTNGKIYWVSDSDELRSFSVKEWNAKMCKDDFHYNQEMDMIPSTRENTVVPEDQSFGLHNMPTEVLINILSHLNGSKDLNNMLLVSNFFYNFILLHQNDISQRYLVRQKVFRKSLLVLQVDPFLLALKRMDSEHHTSANMRRLSNVLDFPLERPTVDFQTQFNDIFVKGKRNENNFIDSEHIVLLMDDALNELNYQIYENIKCDYLIKEKDIKEFEEYFAKLKSESLSNNRMEIDKSEFETFFLSHTIEMPYADWEIYPSDKLFQRLLVLCDIIGKGLPFDEMNVESGLIRLLSIAIKLNVVIPEEMLIEFIQNQQKLKIKEPVAQNESEQPGQEITTDTTTTPLVDVDNTNTDIVSTVNIETSSIKLQSGQLFTLISNYHKEANSDAYAGILEFFEGDHLKSDPYFWYYLRDHAPELINELLHKGVEIDIFILNQLASSMI